MRVRCAGRSAHCARFVQLLRWSAGVWRVRTVFAQRANAPTSNDAYLRWNPFRTVDRRDSQQGKPCHSNQTSSKRPQVSALAALPISQAIGRRRLGRRRHAHQLLSTDFDFDDGEGGTGSDSSSDFAREQRAPLHQRQGHRQHRLHVQHGIQLRRRGDPRHRCRGAILVQRRQAQHLGRPLPAAQRSRQSLRPVLRQQLGRVPGRRAGRLSVRDRRPRRRRHVLGPVRQGQVLGRRIRRHRSDYGRFRRAARRRACRSISGMRKTATT